mgnify:FL=1
MKPEIKSITIYIDSRGFESFIKEGHYLSSDWEHFRRSVYDIQVSISLDAYCTLLDVREREELLKDYDNQYLPF